MGKHQMILQPQSLLQTAKGKMVATIFSPLSNADGRWLPRLLRKKRSENWSADCSKLTALWCLFCASGVQTSHWVAVLNTLGCLHLTSLEFSSLWQIAFCFLSVCQTNRIFPVRNVTVVKLTLFLSWMTENVSSSFFVDTNSGVPCLSQLLFILGTMHCFIWQFACWCSSGTFAFQGFPTRMVYLYYTSRLRYTILVGNPRFVNVCLSLLFESMLIYLHIQFCVCLCAGRKKNLRKRSRGGSGNSLTQNLRFEKHFVTISISVQEFPLCV